MNRYLIGISLALLLADCGGGTPAVPQNASRAQAISAAGSSGALVYVGSETEALWVLTYPQGQRFEDIHFGKFDGLCSDLQGNVFVVWEGRTVSKIVHGGLRPSRSMRLPKQSYSCAVDPRTNSLAVASDKSVEVFPNEEEPFTRYATTAGPSTVTYDGSGNLFVNGGKPGATKLAELSSGAPQVHFISLPEGLKTVGPLGWDGQFITWEDVTVKHGALYRLAISGSQATVVGTTSLGDVPNRVLFGTFYAGRFIAPFSNRGSRGSRIGLWSYPSGGNPQKILRLKTDGHKLLEWLTISAPPSK